MLKFLKRMLVFLVGLVLVVLVSGFVWIHPGRGPVEKVDPNEKGYAEQIDGTLVLHLKGSPYEMGYQRGSLAKDKVQLMMTRFDALLDQAKEEMGLPKFAANLILDITYQLCAPYIPERYKREMEGLADGSGADLQIIRRGQVISVITERGCSSFALWGKATSDGKLYQGRNFDWILSAGLEDTAILALYEPDGRNRFASAGYAGQIGVLSGMNMEGLSIAQIGAVTKDKSLRGIPLEFVLRRILEECSDLDQVTGLIKGAKHTVGYNYVIADGDARDARAYETTAHHVAVFGPNDPEETCEYAIRIEDAVFRADEAMDPTVRGLQECAKAPGLPYGSNSYDHRYKGIATRVQENFGKIDQSIALDILRATAMDDANLHAVLTNTTDRQMWVAHARNGQNASLQTFVHYDLNRLFLRPETRPAETAPVAATPPLPEPAAE
jgi:predicted choloylglycine hydrolase